MSAITFLSYRPMLLIEYILRYGRRSIDPTVLMVGIVIIIVLSFFFEKDYEASKPIVKNDDDIPK